MNSLLTEIANRLIAAGLQVEMSYRGIFILRSGGLRLLVLSREHPPGTLEVGFTASYGLFASEPGVWAVASDPKIRRVLDSFPNVALSLHRPDRVDRLVTSSVVHISNPDEIGAGLTAAHLTIAAMNALCEQFGLGHPPDDADAISLASNSTQLIDQECEYGATNAERWNQTMNTLMDDWKPFYS